MTKEELIDKYNQEWNRLNELYTLARRSKHESDDPEIKDCYQAFQDSYAAQKMQVGYFLQDLQKLKG